MIGICIKLQSILSLPHTTATCWNETKRLNKYNETLANKSYIFVMSCLKVICWALIFIFKCKVLVLIFLMKNNKSLVIYNI
jgi:hypothetical protein